MMLKRITGIVLIFVFLLQCSIKTFIAIAFYMKQDYIAKNLCENRNKANAHCNGMCYLRKQLNKEEKRQTSLPYLEKEKNVLFKNNTVFFFKAALITMMVERCATSFAEIRKGFSNKIFHPPPSFAQIKQLNS